MRQLRFIALTGISSFLCVFAKGNTELSARQTATIPQYVVDYAPLVYLDVNDYYLPSDIGTQVSNTFPAVNFTEISSAKPRYTLSTLSSLNQAADCTRGFRNCDLYLTSIQDETKYPSYFNGTLPDPDTGETKGATACAVIVNDHGNGTVDAFYMYFYAFNLGYIIFGSLLGNHVGDWEHTMLRFVDGEPDTMWFSQHDGGEVYTYSAVSKQQGRPIVYSARGTHANYAVPGVHTRKISVVKLNDQTSQGPLWDPIKNAYFYTFTPSASDSTTNTGTFQGAQSPTASDDPLYQGPPTDWLTFYGRWGNKQLPDSDPAQLNFGNLNITWTWEDGPTGPYDKDLNRQGTCPDGTFPCVTKTVLPSVSGNPSPSTTISRPTATSSDMATTSESSGMSTSSDMGTGTSTSMSTDPAATGDGGGGDGNNNDNGTCRLSPSLSLFLSLASVCFGYLALL